MNPKFLCEAPSHVSLHVKCQVVRPGEGALTQVALEGPVSGVFAEMTSQLIGAGEFPSTAFPAAVVRLLTCEDREMGDYSTVLNGETCFCLFFSYAWLCVITHRSMFIYHDRVHTYRCEFGDVPSGGNSWCRFCHSQRSCRCAWLCASAAMCVVLSWVWTPAARGEMRAV